MRLPDFMIIGSAKSGTTTLYKYLCQHPQIFMTTPKEPSYFADFASGYGKDLNWYVSLFNDAQPKQICGEASTPYTHQTCHKPDIPKLIREVVPNVKMIYIMRHPVDRAYSQYLQQIKLFQGKQRKLGLSSALPETFEALLARGNSVTDTDDYMKKINVVSVSKYIEQIELYLKYFPRESLLFLLFEDLLKQPQILLSEVCNFLGIDNQIDFISKEPIIANVSKDYHQWHLRSKTTEKLRSLPLIQNIYKTVPDVIRDMGYKILAKMSDQEVLAQQYIPKPMLLETRQMLIEKFAEPNRQLAEFLNRDLSHWSN